ncbi:hypothetical protein LCGC14_2152400 [marine sediment metagenome]|uniref:Uncharacterized protein n=1 Tax=marine sediment metagenome TaxID=412755 RepID=A0A0F9G863_9ZZZZ
MAWSPPRTWTDGEVVTAAVMDAHLRDNLLILETPRDASARVSALSSSTLADLSALNLTGLADPGAANSFTAGRHRFNQGAATRFRVPVGVDKWTGTKGVDAAGIWVEGDYLHHISSDITTEWRYLGTFVSTPGGVLSGSLWVEGDDLHYVDSVGDERRCESIGTTGHSDAGALGGSAWVETYTHWTRESGTVEKPGHADITHADHNDHNDHTDHSDSGAHTDHGDHDDVGNPHVDHYDHLDHQDIIHVDDETGNHEDHTDYTDHDDHGDSGPHSDHDDHNDSNPHSDVTADNRPVTV